MTETLEFILYFLSYITEDSYRDCGRQSSEITICKSYGSVGGGGGGGEWVKLGHWCDVCRIIEVVGCFCLPHCFLFHCNNVTRAMDLDQLNM